MNSPRTTKSQDDMQQLLINLYPTPLQINYDTVHKNHQVTLVHWQEINTESLCPSVAMSTLHLAHGSLELRQPSTAQTNADHYYT